MICDNMKSLKIFLGSGSELKVQWVGCFNPHIQLSAISQTSPRWQRLFGRHHAPVDPVGPERDIIERVRDKATVFPARLPGTVKPQGLVKSISLFCSNHEILENENP